MKLGFLASAFVALFFSTAHTAQPIKIVGSSTVFPFSTSVAEAFSASTKYPTPVVESTGSGGGLKLFCKGLGKDTPDITNASRRIKQKEIKLCMRNGVTDVKEVLVGYDGIVVANSKTGPTFTLTKDLLFNALVERKNKPVLWSDLDPSLPPLKIKVLGPPPSSGTRDAFEEFVMKGEPIRSDGAYVDAGENDNLIVKKLTSDKNAVGVFGFSFLEQNADKIKGITIDGVEPTFDNIKAKTYPLSRSLYFYVKLQHYGVVPGLKEYVEFFEANRGEDFLIEKGLIPLD